MAGENAGASGGAGGTAPGAASAGSTGSPQTGVISDATRAALGLQPDVDSENAGGASNANGNPGGPAAAGQPSEGATKPTTDAGAGAEGSQTPKGDEGPGTGDGNPEDEAAVNGLLAKYGLKPLPKADANGNVEGNAAGAANIGTKASEGDINTLVTRIKKEINADGTVPLEQQVEKAAAMAAAGQQQIGKMGNELGAYRNLFDTLTAQKWFDKDAKTGKVTPNIVNLADALTPDQFTAQIQSEAAQEKLAARGLKIVPLDFVGEPGTGKDALARFEEAAAAKLVPGKAGETLTHEERLRIIEENPALARRFTAEVVAAQSRADADAGARRLQSEAQLTQARQEVQDALKAMATDKPDLWNKLAPGIAHYGTILPASIPHMEGLKFAVGRAFHDKADEIIAEALRAGIAIGRKRGQGDAGLLVAPGSVGGGGANPGSSQSSDGSVVSTETRKKLGLPDV